MLLLWKDEPANNKDTDGLPTSPPTWNIVWAPVLHKEGFQVPVSSLCWKMIKLRICFYVSLNNFRKKGLHWSQIIVCKRFPQLSIVIPKVMFWSHSYDPETGSTLYWYYVSKWHTQNDILIETNIQKYGSTNHKRPVYSIKMRTFHKGTLPWKALWRWPLLAIITVQAVG